MQASVPSIAVVVPLYNKEDAIVRTIESILNQSRPPDELVIVDDGSSDNSLELARQAIAKAGDKVKAKVIAQENAGVSVARNRGADESSANYIAFMDADDEWLPDYLAELEKLTLACPTAGFLTIRHGKVNADGSLIAEPCSLGDAHFGLVYEPLKHYRQGYGLIHTSASTVRRDAWQRSGGFPPGARKSQDMHLWLRLCLTEEMAHSGKTLVIWHDDFSGVSRRKGVVPAHFLYFLGSEEGKRYLENPALVEFLGSNMLAHIGGHRLTEDEEVIDELKRLSAALPFTHRFKCWLVSVIPLGCLRLLVQIRQRARGLKR